MRGAPVQAPAPQAASWAADILDREASDIVRRWLERLKAEPPARPDPCLQDLQAQGMQLMHGISEALRLDRPPAGAPWLTRVRRHAELHVGEGAPLGSVLHEYRVLWEEIRRALQAHLGAAPLGGALAIAGPLEGASDAVADAASAAYDAAARRALEQAEIARGRLEAVLDQMPSGVIIAEAPSGRLILANKEVERIWRHPFWRSKNVEEYRRWEIYALDGRPLEPEETALARAVQRGELVAGEEEKIRRGDGTWSIVLTRATPIRDTEGRVIAGVLVFDDITERKRAEEERERLLAEIRQRVAELDVTLTAVADGLIIYDPLGAIVRINPAAESILGYSPAQMRWPYVERAVVLRVQAADGTPIAPHDQPPGRALRGETVHGQTMVIHRASDGRPFWISTSAAPIYAPDGRMLGAVVTFSDITARHELEEQRNDILRAVSHDLRNPLAAVQGQAQLLLHLLDKSGHGAAERTSVEAIVTSARRMNTMIQDLVDSARSESGQLRLKPQPVDLPSFARSLLQRQGAALDAARVRVEPAEGLPQVYADPDLLERILVNLLSNALKYSDPSTEVTVRFEVRGNDVATLVIDRGRGIPPEDMPRLFQRYYRVDGGREGVGLGLYITRTFVEAHGGRIWAESQVGRGSTFIFTLPIVQDRERQG